jgi:hypothetical protein
MKSLQRSAIFWINVLVLWGQGALGPSSWSWPWLLPPAFSVVWFGVLLWRQAGTDLEDF